MRIYLDNCSYNRPYDDQANMQVELEAQSKLFIQNKEPEISEIASDIMATGIKEKDAYHVASAIYGGCGYFISTDKRLLKYKNDKIKLVTPVEFVSATEGVE